MFRKIILAAAIGLMTTGAALAQSDAGGTNATDHQSGAASAPGVLNDPVMMKPFYTDDTMQTMRPAEEFAAALKAMNSDDREKIAKECENVTSLRATFCQSFIEANKM